MKLDERVTLRLHRMVWPQSAVALRAPKTADFPAPRDFAAFGAGSWLVPPASVSGAAQIEIGTGVVLMEHAELRAGAAAGVVTKDPLLRIGDGTRLARFVTIWATVGIEIGQGVSSSDYVAVLDCWGSPDSPTPPPGAPIVIGDGAYLGCRSVITPGVTVGEGAFVGEGAVVLDDVPAHSVVYGNPARVTSRWSKADGWSGDMFGRSLS